MESKIILTLCVIFGIFVDSMTVNMVVSFLPDLLTRIGGNSTDLGVIMSLNSFGDILGSLGFGYLDTRYKSKWLLLLFGLVISFLPNLFMSIFQNYWSLVLGRFLQGLASGSIWVCGLALIADYEGKDNSNTTLAWVYSSSNFGGLISPIIAGYLFNYHPSVPFLLLGSLCVIQFVLLAGAFKCTKSYGTDVDDSSSDATLLQVVSSLPTPNTPQLGISLLRNCKLSLLLIYTLIIVTIGTAMYVSLIIQLSYSYALSAEQIGLCFLVIAPPQVLACVLGGLIYDRFGFRYTSIASLLLTATASLSLVLPLSLPFFLTSMAIFVSGSMILITPILPEISILVPEESRSLAFSMFNISVSSGMMLGPLLGSFLYSSIGLGMLAAVIAVSRVLAMGLVYFYQSPEAKRKEPCILVV